MSPTTLKAQISQMAGELRACISLCTTIREHTKFSSTHINLDKLQHGLENSERQIPAALSASSQRVGAQVERGDALARNQMHLHIEDIQSEIKHRLRCIAGPTPPKHPGFRAQLDQLKRTHRAALRTIADLAQRITDAEDQILPPPAPAPAPSHRPIPAAAVPAPRPAIRDASPPSPLRRRPSIPSVLEPADHLAELLQYRASCWDEVLCGGRICYVNAFDRHRQTWDRPAGAYIKDYVPLSAARPATAPRTPSFERQQREQRSLRRTSRA